MDESQNLAEQQPPKRKLLSVTVTLRDPTIFLVEVDWCAPSLNVVRCMLNEALAAVNEKIQDEAAIKFQRKMAMAAAGTPLMTKKPPFA